MATPDSDALSPFLIDAAGARGACANVSAAYREVLSRHTYPPLLRGLLGELLAASALLAGSLKFKGSLVLQLQGDGPLRLMVVECSHDLGLRAMAQWRDDFPAAGDLRVLAGKGRFALTLDPKQGGELHQGIIPLEAGTVAELLEHYLQRSEQLPRRLWLTAQEGIAAGLLLQRLAGHTAQGNDGWNHVSVLGSTVTEAELRGLNPVQLLTRLFPDADVRLFPARAVRFHCPCSRERVTGALRLVGRDEIEGVLRERGEVEVPCEFCNRRYRFDAADVAAVFAGEPAATRH